MADRTKLDEYITELEAAAYERGRVAGRAEVMEKLQGIRQDLEKWITEAREGLTARLTGADLDEVAGAEPREPREGSDQAKVLDVIREHPGLRGMEVVRALKGAVEERTVRTALHRLKRRNAIIQREGGAWYPVPMSLFQNNEGQTP